MKNAGRQHKKAKNTTERLIEYIKENGYKDGDRILSERKLAEEMGVSRTTVREALKNLSSIGYIESVHGYGTFVRQVNFETFIDPLSAKLDRNLKLMREVLEVRRLLECETVKMAARKLDDEGKHEIELAMKRMEAEVERGETGVIGDGEFHEAIAKASGNEAMAAIGELCRDILNATRTATLKDRTKALEALEDHKTIADAIFAGDPEKAEEAMKAHINKAKTKLGDQE
ncbi:MAG: FadR family transcriptional regulator [Clostridia bacterium]|jgi:GntR family transcriptional repressor for pyruvate dehydrogenase complex|nr:FadR family transcriptional regulator [Clostridia bacterium]